VPQSYSCNHGRIHPLAIENSKSGKVTVVVAILKVFEDTPNNLRNNNPGKLLSVDPTGLQKIPHSLQDASSVAAKAQNDQVVSKMIANARKGQEKKSFEQVVGLCNGHCISADVEDLVSDGDGDDIDLFEGNYEILFNGNGLDNSGLSRS
jgi:hypothetical protein